jgi:hypothetical protein
MVRHVTLLAILWNIWGALSLLLGLSLLLLAAGAWAARLDPDGEAMAVAAGVTAVLLATLALLTLLWGGAHVWAGTLVARRAPSGRILSLALALVNLLVLPFGTALGAYALWVLLPREARQLFEPPPAAPAAAR